MNKKIISTLLILSFFCNQTVFAETTSSSRQDEIEQNETDALEGKQTQEPLQEIGLEEASVAKPRNDSNLQNWLFAAGSIVSATIAIIVVSLSEGAAPNSN